MQPPGTPGDKSAGSSLMPRGSPAPSNASRAGAGIPNSGTSQLAMLGSTPNASTASASGDITAAPRPAGGSPITQAITNGMKQRLPLASSGPSQVPMLNSVPVTSSVAEPQPAMHDVEMGQPAAGADGAQPGGDAPPPPEPRVVLLKTEPIVHKRTFVHSMAGAFGVQIDDVTGVDATNMVITSKYTLLTFLPTNLFQQFMRIANLYFLLIAGLQLIPGLSPTSWFTTVFPLCCVLIFNAIKEAIDDKARHKSDDETNSRKVLLLKASCGQHHGGHHTKWRDLRCGNVIKIRQDEEIPADVIVLTTSDDTHVCHVETANLDGETNLKLKQAVDMTKHVTHAEELKDFEDNLAIHTEQPNPKLYAFDGAIVNRTDETQPSVSLTVDNLLLRGSTLRKTNWVVGVVVFAGADTKIMMNRTLSPRKVTQLEHHMNVLVLSIFSTMLIFSFMLALGSQVYQARNTNMWYLEWQGEWPDLGPSFTGWIIQVLRFIILLNGMIPISLYVTVEMVKVLQCLFILNSDRQMYHADTDTPFKCRTTNLNEDLGQVEYVLSDKTGTLTQNVMGFVWASIDAKLYGKPAEPEPAQPLMAGVRGGQSGPSTSAPSKKNIPSHVPAKTPHSLLLDSELHAKLGAPFAELAGNVPSTTQTEPDPAVAAFFINLAVCNTVVPQVLEDGRFVYQASSPDEEALVEGAAMAGYKLINRSPTEIKVEFHGEQHEYKVLVVLEFNSDRKRMSVVARCPDGKIRLFCKGADTVIMTRLRPDKSLTASVREHLGEMAAVGYRTLCVAQKELTNEQWNAWWTVYHAASVSIEDRDYKVSQAAEKIESDLDLIGATAVEDKLQDGVPDAIAMMVAAGIKVWVLTGDKVETAISVAYSCKLFSGDMSIMELRDRNFETQLAAAGARRPPGSSVVAAAGDGAATEPFSDLSKIIEIESEVLQKMLESVEAENLTKEYEVKMAAEGKMSSRFTLTRPQLTTTATASKHVGLVVEGGALAVGLQAEHQEQLMKLCSSCKNVVFCRVSPMQKAAVTKLVQKTCGAITLGIGDGANDVGMIQAAHIGCGISGREGRAAVMASDYSFAQFRFVARLLLIHGRSTYQRNSEVVLYSFYKNWLNNLTYVYYAFVSAWSCQPMYTTGLISTLNLFWAALPIIGYAFTEKDVSDATILAYPFLYKDSMLANRRSFLWSQLRWFGLGTWHSLVIYFVPMYSMGMTPDSSGHNANLWMVGTTMYTAIVIVVNLKIAMRTRYWTWLNHLLIWGTIGLWFPFVWLYGIVWPVSVNVNYPVDGTADMSDMAQLLYGTPSFWLAGFLLAPAFSLLLDIAVMAFRKHLKPEMHEVLQEWEYEKNVRDQALAELFQGQPGIKTDGAGGQQAANGAPVGDLNEVSKSIAMPLEQGMSDEEGGSPHQDAAPPFGSPPRHHGPLPGASTSASPGPAAVLEMQPASHSTPPRYSGAGPSSGYSPSPAFR